MVTGSGDRADVAVVSDDLFSRLFSHWEERILLAGGEWEDSIEVKDVSLKDGVWTNMKNGLRLPTRS